MFGKLFHVRANLTLWAPIVAFVILALLDPDYGIARGHVNLPSITVWLLMAARVVFFVSMAHWMRKALFPYFDMREFMRVALRDPVAAALCVLGVVAFIISTMWLLSGTARAATCGDEVVKARPYLPMLKAEQMRLWNDHPQPSLLASLGGHESGCPCMRKCWNPGQRFEGYYKDTGTRREIGAGIPQMTIAWTKDGRVRLDALGDMARRHRGELDGLTWDNLDEQPQMQMRFMVLMMRDNFQSLRAVRDSWQRLAFADAAYNGGLGGVNNERMACGVRKGCDPQAWFGNVERVCLKSTAAMYGQRSACDINRHHVKDVLVDRAPKYAGTL